MVKLIKLNAPFNESEYAINISNKAQFTAYFNEDIIIKPNSRIALRNIQFSTTNYDDVESGQGLKISLEDNLDGSKNWKTLLIPPDQYVDNELNSYLYTNINSMFEQLDCPLIRAGIYNRVMFQTGYTDKQLYHIDFKFVEDYYNTNLTTSENIEYDNGTLIYTKTDNDGAWDYVNTGNLPLCLGTGTLNLTLTDDININGVAIGIMDKVVPSTETVSDTDFYFKVYTENDTYWYIKKNDEATDTGVECMMDDLVEIKVEKGFFSLYITRESGEVIDNIVNQPIIYTYILNEDYSNAEPTNYYGYFGLKDEESQMKDIRWTQNPYYSSNENGIVKTPTPTPHIVVDSLSDAVPSTVSLDFLAQFGKQLGYNQVYYQSTGVSGSFVGDLTTTDVSLPDGFYVVLNNIRLSAYDYSSQLGKNNPTQQGRRKNIVANVTSFDFLTNYNLITYETDAPTFIDMDNTQPINLNTIEVTVYDNDNNIILLGLPDPDLITTENKCLLKLTLLVD